MADDQQVSEEHVFTQASSSKKAKISCNEKSSASTSSSDRTTSPSISLPLELQSIDFTKRIKWGKYTPYTDTPIPLTPEGTEPIYTSQSPALCHYINAMSGRARACTLHFQAQPGQTSSAPRPVPTPIFMPVGTKGCLKGVTFEELTSDPALQCPIILANTYHLAIQPGTELIDEIGGLHVFQGLPSIGTAEEGTKSYNLLTDSGGFQMVSLVKLSEVTEQGVSFENPYQQSIQPNNSQLNDHDLDNETPRVAAPNMLLLTPEDSIRHQNNIGANIIMALDDVISTVTADDQRFIVATHRTLRWYDRCYTAHQKRSTQNLFPIVQGGIDTALGGLREQCLAGFRHRQEERHYITPGYAIGGLAGGEAKTAFWRVVDQCCRALPDNKPRYLMGVGYPLDLVVCTALGVDMYDCVYPTRTARFGVALIPGRAPGTLRLKGNECSMAGTMVIQEKCLCQACREGISRSRLYTLFKTGNPVALELITQHNIAYMMSLGRNMRQAILEDRFAEFARSFVRMQYPGKQNGAGDDPPEWVVEALAAAGIDLNI